MMQVTYLEHSGFLVELPSVTLLFDWWKGTLPPLPEKPLLVFASHQHPDHFSPKIFTLDDGSREIRFMLGKDIRLTDKNRQKWSVSDSAAAKCTRMGRQETLEALPGVTVETLPSTDEGVAFLVTAEGLTIFHAGDLNWWHWAEEPDPWNPNMARDFRAYAAPLQGRKIDLAMLPLDPRLGEAGFWGPRHFLETADIRRFLPMHQWDAYDLTEQFLSAYPQFADRTIPVTKPGQSFSFGV